MLKIFSCFSISYCIFIYSFSSSAYSSAKIRACWAANFFYLSSAVCMLLPLNDPPISLMIVAAAFDGLSDGFIDICCCLAILALNIFSISFLSYSAFESWAWACRLIPCFSFSSAWILAWACFCSSWACLNFWSASLSAYSLALIYSAVLVAILAICFCASSLSFLA